MTARTTPTQGAASARGEDVIEPRRIDATTIHSGLRGHAGTRSGRPSQEGNHISRIANRPGPDNRSKDLGGRELDADDRDAADVMVIAQADVR